MQEFNIGRDASELFISYYKNKNWIIKEIEVKIHITNLMILANLFLLSCLINHAIPLI